MSGEVTDKAKRIVQEVLARLSPERIKRDITDPVDRVLDLFQYDENEPFSLRHFLEVMGRFIQCLYRDGLRLKYSLTLEQSRNEALWLLRNYQSSDVQRYGAALCDAAKWRRDTAKVRPIVDAVLVDISGLPFAWWENYAKEVRQMVRQWNSNLKWAPKDL